MIKFNIALFAIFIALSQPLFAQDDDDEILLEELVVTGIRATQGGAQDIDFFRGEVEQARIPHPSTITAEGLFSQHDILFPANKPCEQLFCLTNEVAPANLIVQPEARMLVGLGFTSSLEQEKWKRRPVNLVAVVDKSGSMHGEPLARVRDSLQKILDLLTPEDQLSIVLYGDTSHVYLPPTRTTKANKRKVSKAIGEITSAGSTFMEAGLKVGYELAFQSMNGFEGMTRLMLFTDERPNVGKTDAASFIGMAQAASHKHVGLTTIGVGQQFGAELATKISSIRGGNLFFIQNKDDVNALFATELDFMISELAHDLNLTITPHADFAIAGIYGIPGEMLGWQKDRSVSVTIPTVFLSSKGGAIFFSLATKIEDNHLPAKVIEPGANLATVQLNYISAFDGKKASDTLAVKATNTEASAGMQLGHLLVDEFTALHRATSEHYFNNDQEKAYQIIRELNARITQSPLEEAKGEVPLTSALEDRFAFLSGHGSEAKGKNAFAQLWGKWEVARKIGRINIKKSDILQFTPENEFSVFRKEDGKYEQVEFEDYVSNNEQIYLMESELTFEYKVLKDKLRIKHPRTGVKLWLKPADDKQDL